MKHQKVRTCSQHKRDVPTAHRSQTEWALTNQTRTAGALKYAGTSLAVQWLRLHASHKGGAVAWQGQNKSCQRTLAPRTAVAEEQGGQTCHSFLHSALPLIPHQLCLQKPLEPLSCTHCSLNLPSSPQPLPLNPIGTGCAF